MVLGIIPNTPAADLGLKIGEIITKVNGIEVKMRRTSTKRSKRTGLSSSLKSSV